MRRWLIFIVLFLTGYAASQNTPTIGTLPDNGPSLPATCVIGQIYFRTATTIGLNQCNPNNVWTALATGSGGPTINPTNNVIPVRSNATSFIDSPFSVASGNVTSSGIVLIPTGSSGAGSCNATNISLAFAGNPTSGLAQDGANFTTLCSNGTRVLEASSTGVFISAPIQDFSGADQITIASNSISVTGSGSPNGQIERGFNINVTPVTVNASVTTDQNLMSVTMPANTFNVVGRTYRVFVAGVYSTAAASTAQMTLKIKICSVSGCGSGNVASTISIQSAALGTLTITNNAWNGTFYITTQTASTAGAWEAHGAFGIDEGALATAADSFFNDSNTTTVTGSPSAIDTTAQNFLQVTFAFSAGSASNSATERQLVVEVVN